MRDKGAIWFRAVRRGSQPAIGESVFVNAVLTVGRWYHVAATYDYESGAAKVYVDGVMRGENGE
jgi:hypothetical protein